MQTTSNLLMIRPVNFEFNVQTAVNNKFQQVDDNPNNVQEKALLEFDNFVALLRKNDINVVVIEDTPDPITPDSIFPNNWISFHQDGSVYLYPMFSENRRPERRKDIIQNLSQHFQVNHQSDLSFFEQAGQFLEGTGSMVLDREHKIAYACMSIRTDAEVLAQFCALSGYKAVTFHAVDQTNFPIYHTNVMMCVGTKFILICAESIPDPHERQYVLKQIAATGKEIIEISFTQMNHFAGNMLEVENNKGEKFIIMSEQAYQILNPQQIVSLEAYGKILHAPLYTIEKNGGGSARCMLAEIHLPKN
ncbi:MAG: amidinotransferase [Pedobacter sp.]|nr:MAG: amidinotransferase [Pedobacter sp.]